jgi:hypothetical protein
MTPLLSPPATNSYQGTVEAFYKGTLVHRGPVTEVAPAWGLFWILDTLTGSRRLLDVSEFSIVRMPEQYREVQLTAPRP